MQYVAHVKQGVVWQPQQKPNYLTTLNGTAATSPNAGAGPRSIVAVVNQRVTWQPQQKPNFTTINVAASDVRIGLDTEGWPPQTFNFWDFAQKPSLLVIQPAPVAYNPATDVTRLQPMAKVWGEYQTFVQPRTNFTIVLNPPPAFVYNPATDVTKMVRYPNVWNEYKPFPMPAPGLFTTTNRPPIVPVFGPGQVPNLVGMILQEAEQALQNANILNPGLLGYFGIWPITVIWVINPAKLAANSPSNFPIVVAQSIPPGTFEPPNTPITLTVVRPAGAVGYPGTQGAEQSP